MRCPRTPRHGVDRLTLNYGARVDWASMSIPEQTKPGGRFVPEVFFPEVPLPDFGPDFAPRLSIAYDLFGDAKTALKASYGRNYESVGYTFPEAYSNAAPLTERRDWFDQHLTPDGSAISGLNPYGTNGDDIAQDWEIGSPVSSTFGLAVGRDAPDENYQRMRNDVITVQIQQEVADGISVSLEVNKRVYGDVSTGNNLNRTAADFGSSLMIARPAPFVGAVEVFNIDDGPARTSTTEVDRLATGDYRRGTTGVGLSANARLPNGGTVFGGWTAGTTRQDDCGDELDSGDDLNNLRFCNEFAFPKPYKHEFKVSAVTPVTLPGVGDLQLGMSFLGYPGGRGGFDVLRQSFIINRSATLQGVGSVFATYAAPFYTAETCVAPCVLGAPYIPRDANPTIGTSTASYTVPLIPGDSVKHLPNWVQLDVNVAKVFNLGGWRYDVRAELFNVTNAGFDLSHSNGVNNLNLLTSKWVEVSEPAQPARCLQPICHRVTTID